MHASTKEPGSCGLVLIGPCCIVLIFLIEGFDGLIVGFHFYVYSNVQLCSLHPH